MSRSGHFKSMASAHRSSMSPPMSVSRWIFVLMRDLLSWQPAQIGFAGSQCLVEPAHGRVVRRGLDDFGIGAGFLGDLAHDADEVVEGLAGLGFGWLDHHGFVYDEGEVDGRGVHA